MLGVVLSESLARGRVAKGTNSLRDNTHAFHRHISRKNRSRRNASTKRSHLDVAGYFPQDILSNGFQFVVDGGFFGKPGEYGSLVSKKHLFWPSQLSTEE